MATEKKDIIIGAKDQTKGAINSVKSGLKGVGTSWMEVAKGMLAWNVFAQLGRAAVDFIKSSIEAFGQQEQAVARLTAALKNQNQYTEDNIQALKDQAKALQQVTTFGDEQIISAQAMLGSFALTTEQIKEMTPRMLDLATMTAKTTGGQMDLEQAAKFVGMALGGQAGRLTQAGIRLDDYQKKAFQAADENERFNMLLEIFDQNAKGMAESVGKTATGSMIRFGNVISDIKEDLGEELIPIIVDDLIPALQAILPVVARFAGITVKLIKLVISQFQAFYEKTKWIWDKLGGAVDWFSKTIDKALDKANAKTKESEQTSDDYFNSVMAGAAKAANAVIANDAKKTVASEEEEKKRIALKKEFDKQYHDILMQDTEYQLADLEKRRAAYEAAGISKHQLDVWQEEEKKKIDDKAREREEKEHERKTKRLSDLTSAFDSSFGSMADSQGSFEEASKSSGKAILGFLKRQLKGQIDAWGAAEAAKAWAAAPLTLGASLGALAPIAAAVAAGHAAIDAIRLAKGGIVTKPTKAVIGEEGPEAVIPLKSPKGKEALKNINSNYNININVGAFMGNKSQAKQFAKMIYFYIKEIERRDLTV